MATVSDLANVKSCAATDLKGTGNKHKKFKLGVIRKVALSKRGFDYNGITDFTQANIAVEIQKGNIIPFKKLFNFEPQNESNVYETSQIGVNSLARKGLYNYKLTWTGDDQLQEVCSAYDSEDEYDIAFIDENGSWKLVNNDTEWNGASVGIWDTEPYINPDGSNSGKVSVMVQLNDPIDNNENAQYIDHEKLAFNMTKQEGINDIDLTMTSYAASATSITFTAYLKDGCTLFSSGTDADFRLTINGTVETITGNVAYANGVYTISSLTALAADDVIKLSTYDSTTSTVAIIKDTTDVYSGKEISVTVA